MSCDHLLHKHSVAMPNSGVQGVSRTAPQIRFGAACFHVDSSPHDEPLTLQVRVSERCGHQGERLRAQENGG